MRSVRQNVDDEQRTTRKQPNRASMAGHPLLALQHQAGNAAVASILQRSPGGDAVVQRHKESPDINEVHTLNGLDVMLDPGSPGKQINGKLYVWGGLATLTEKSG